METFNNTTKVVRDDLIEKIQTGSRGNGTNSHGGEKENRYMRLMNRIIKPGVKTKVLMLSATPVNNRFNDLKNQLALAYEGDPEEINEKLNTKSDIKIVPNHGFETVKPLELIKRLVFHATDKDSIILDFFSGSATTGQAVMQLNAEDGGNRRYILIQIPGKTDGTIEVHKSNFDSICDIGEERIRRACKKIKEETGADIDYGFRCFKVDSSNMKDVYYKPNEIGQMTLDQFTDNIKEDRTPEDLLIQVMLDLGVLLSSNIEKTEIGGKKVFSVADGYLIACFDNDVTEDVVTEIVKKHPFYAVFRDSSMASDSVAANVEQIFETYSPQTVRKVL